MYSKPKYYSVAIRAVASKGNNMFTAQQMVLEATGDIHRKPYIEFISYIKIILFTVNLQEDTEVSMLERRFMNQDLIYITESSNIIVMLLLTLI